MVYVIGVATSATTRLGELTVTKDSHTSLESPPLVKISRQHRSRTAPSPLLSTLSPYSILAFLSISRVRVRVFSLFRSSKTIWTGTEETATATTLTPTTTAILGALLGPPTPPETIIAAALAATVLASPVVEAEAEAATTTAPLTVLPVILPAVLGCGRWVAGVGDLHRIIRCRSLVRNGGLVSLAVEGLQVCEDRIEGL